MNDSLVVDDLTFTVRRSDVRRTVGITVERDGSLSISAPQQCEAAVLERVVRAKQGWVYTKLAQKDVLFPGHSPKEFVPGEGFYYLGRSYRLRLIDADGARELTPLCLRTGRFELLRSVQPRAYTHFREWYGRHAQAWLEMRSALLSDRIGVHPSALRVLTLGNRWGSCTAKGDLLFHWRTILLPPRMAEYIVAHEMVHFLEPNHTSAFWKRVEQAIPDYKLRKQWLAENGALFSL